MSPVVAPAFDSTKLDSSHLIIPSLTATVYSIRLMYAHSRLFGFMLCTKPLSHGNKARLIPFSSGLQDHIGSWCGRLCPSALKSHNRSNAPPLKVRWELDRVVLSLLPILKVFPRDANSFKKFKEIVYTIFQPNKSNYCPKMGVSFFRRSLGSENFLMASWYLVRKLV